MVCPHGHLESHMVRRCRTFHAIFAFEQHTWLDDVRHGMPSSPLIAHMVVQHRACHDIITLRHDTRSYDVGRGMPSSPLSSSQGRDMSGEACHHIPWTTYTVEKRRAFHAIVVFGLHTKSDDVRHGMPTCPLGSKHCLTTSGKTFHHRPWTTYKVRRRRA